MCGFAGRLDYDGPANQRLVRAMTDALAHRGPDDAGLIVQGACALGHRRLSIVDLAGGHQPLANEDGTVWVAFNGEIYNHVELRRWLESRGHVFETRSDTEVLVHAYEEEGPRLVERLRGMFAFAIWDRKRQRLVLARDRLGIKPLYYAETATHLAFASELRALLVDRDVDRGLDESALACYLALRYVPAPRTLLAGVRKLEPGHLLVVENGRARVAPYWDLAEVATQDQAPPTEAEAALRLRELVDDTVAMRLMSEVPLGAFLSGGVDSTVVTASMLRRTKGDQLKTFSVGYLDEPDDSELEWARLAASELGTEHHEIHVAREDATRALPEIVWGLDEPIADPACVPLWFLARRARQDVTVVLSGEGGDEILAGYAGYRWMMRMESLRRALPGVGLVGGLADLVPRRPSSFERWRRAAQLFVRPLEERYRGVSRAFDDEGRHRLLSLDAHAADRALAEAIGPIWERTRGMTPLRRMLYLDTRVWLPDDLLMKADKMTMATAIELRVPLLDHVLVEWAWSLPDRFKVRGDEGKRLLRRAARGRVPQPILDRPKQGFATPTGAWLRKSLGPTLRETLLDRGALGRGRFDRGELESLLAAHRDGRDRTPELWSLLVLELWWARARQVEPLADDEIPSLSAAV